MLQLLQANPFDITDNTVDQAQIVYVLDCGKAVPSEKQAQNYLNKWLNDKGYLVEHERVSRTIGVLDAASSASQRGIVRLDVWMTSGMMPRY